MTQTAVNVSSAWHEVATINDGAQGVTALPALKGAGENEENTQPIDEQTPNDEQVAIVSVIDRTQYNINGVILSSWVKVGNRELNKGLWYGCQTAVSE